MVGFQRFLRLVFFHRENRGLEFRHRVLFRGGYAFLYLCLGFERGGGGAERQSEFRDASVLFERRPMIRFVRVRARHEHEQRDKKRIDRFHLRFPA